MGRAYVTIPRILAIGPLKLYEPLKSWRSVKTVYQVHCHLDSDSDTWYLAFFQRQIICCDIEDIHGQNIQQKIWTMVVVVVEKSFLCFCPLCLNKLSVPEKVWYHVSGACLVPSTSTSPPRGPNEGHAGWNSILKLYFSANVRIKLTFGK